MYEIKESPLSIDACHAAVAAPSAGAVALFVGTVRNHSAGQRVASLEYEAYKGMAEREMLGIAEELMESFAGVKLACQHRVGHLQVGEAAVVCAVSSAHREAAFEACQLFINRLKERVPIWKREHGENGPYWVEWEDARVAPNQEAET